MDSVFVLLHFPSCFSYLDEFHLNINKIDNVSKSLKLKESFNAFQIWCTESFVDGNALIIFDQENLNYDCSTQEWYIYYPIGIQKSVSSSASHINTCWFHNEVKKILETLLAMSYRFVKRKKNVKDIQKLNLYFRNIFGFANNNNGIQDIMSS